MGVEFRKLSIWNNRYINVPPFFRCISFASKSQLIIGLSPEPSFSVYGFTADAIQHVAVF